MNNFTPLVSIIISTLNSEEYLEKSLISSINQTYSNKEIILIDCLSKDDTYKIIQKYSKYIKYSISEKDTGIYNAWNKGLKKSCGDWICFIGSDDEWYSNDSLELLVKSSVLDNDINFVSGKIYIIDKNDNFISTMGKEWNVQNIKNNITIGHPGSLHKKSLFEKYGLFDESYKICGDYEFLIRNRKNIKANFVNDYIVRMRNSGVSNNKPFIAFNESAQALFKNLNFGFYFAFKFYFLSIIKYTVRKIIIK